MDYVCIRTEFLRPFILCAKVSLLVIFLVSCESSITSSSTDKTQTINNTYTGFPTQLKTTFDDFLIKSTNISSGSNNAPTILLSHLLEITKSNDNLNYIGVAISLNTENQDSTLMLKEIPLKFPPGIRRASNGKTKFYIYTGPNNTEIRRFEAIVPDHPSVKGLMNKWLKFG